MGKGVVTSHRPGWAIGRLGPIGTGVGYFLTAYVALLLTHRPSGTVTLWAPSGVLFAALVLSDRRSRIWHALAGACASLAANWLAGAEMTVALGFTAANVIESVLAAYLVCGAAWRIPSFIEPREVLRFCLVAMGAAMLSASLGWLASVSPSPDFWASWFSTDFLGLLVVAPVILTAHRAWPRGEGNGMLSALPAIIDMAVMTAVAIAAFIYTSYSLLFLPLAASFIVTLRRGPLGAAASVTIIAATGCLFTALGYGPLAISGKSEMSITLYFQFYLLVVVASGLPIASLLALRGRLLDRLAETNRLLMIAEASSRVGHWRLDIQSGIVFASPASLGIRGVSGRDSFPLKETMDFYHPEDRNIVDAAIKMVTSGAEGGFEFEARMITPKGERYVRSCGTADRAADGTLIGVVGTLQDISEQRATELFLLKARDAAEEAAKLALAEAETDQLTGIANRRKLLATVERHVDRARDGRATLSCAMIDIDHFKSINDRFGHGVGDRVLQAIVATAKDALRTNDLIGRLGGEEFVVLLPDAAEDQAIMIGERIRAAIEGSRYETLPKVTVSIGIATYAGDASADDLLARADAALYAAKGAGRNVLRLAA
jgi:diguanylate cyclase (GGDEF)-like protein